MSEKTYPHIPVLLKEVATAFASCQIPTFYDGTVGAGGHAEAILSQHPEIKLYFAIDRDPAALAIARERLAPWGEKVVFLHQNYQKIPDLWADGSLPKPHAILLDLGLSSLQLDTPNRGFSFSKEAPLDMRMDPSLPSTAADILQEADERELGRIFRTYGEERHWRRIARTIVARRSHHPFITTTDLASIMGKPKPGQIHPATRVFQALRIAVNGELEALDTFLPAALHALESSGRIAVISFHSLEDRRVKQAFLYAARDKEETSGIVGLFRNKEPTLQIVTRKALTPSLEERTTNPRARSAKLRVAEKM